MEVGEVGSGVELLHVDGKLVDCVGAVDEEGDSLLGEELAEGVDGADNSRGGDYVVEDGEPDLPGVGVDHVLHLQLDVLRAPQVILGKLNLS